MKLSKGLCDYISTSTGITIGGRVFYRTAPDKAQTPYVILDIMSKVQDPLTTLNTYRVRVRSVGSSSTQAQDLADSVLQKLTRVYGNVAGINCEFIKFEQRYELTKTEVAPIQNVVVDDYIVHSFSD